jgi:hypothetical protein
MQRKRAAVAAALPRTKVIELLLTESVATGFLGSKSRATGFLGSESHTTSLYNCGSSGTGIGRTGDDRLLGGVQGADQRFLLDGHDMLLGLNFDFFDCSLSSIARAVPNLGVSAPELLSATI